LSMWGIREGEEFLDYYRGSRASYGAFIDVAEEEGFELIPTIHASTSPSVTVPREVFNHLLGKLLDGVKMAGKVDGVLLSMHGGGYSEEYPDLEGKVFEEVRRVVGPDVPIGSMHDFHSNITQKWVDNVNVILGYDTYPHVDVYERALEVAGLIVRTIRKEIRPTMAMAKPGMVPALQAQFTGRHPFKTLLEKAHEFEEEEKVLGVWVAGGFPWSDFPDVGMGVIAITDNDLELAEKKAREIADLAWRMRRDFLVGPMPVREAIEEAMGAEEGPYVLADIGDNPGGGGPCDGTVLLKALVEMGAQNAVLAVMKDPEAVAKALGAGVGEEVTMKIGGKTDEMHGPPLEVTGRVKVVSDGRFMPTGPMARGLEADLGRTVVLRVGGVDVILAERRVQPTTLALYRSVGIEPKDKRIIAVKSSVHYRAAHTPIAKKIVEVDTPGVTSPRLAGFPFKNLKRPMFPFDVETLGIVELKTMEEE
ncbi:MAG: M81 family metallopeptidase, partial [Candidatus Bathyarchaeia archaeon]